MTIRQLPFTALLALACLAGAVPAQAAARSAAHAAVHTVAIEAMQFSTARLEVKPGDTVVWRNKDPFAHTVTADDKQFNSGEIQSGASWKFKARKKGTYPYVCTLHPGMKGVLVVK